MFNFLKKINLINSFGEDSNYYKNPTFLIETLRKYGSEKGLFRTITILALELHDLMFDMINKTNTYFPAHLEDLDIKSKNIIFGKRYTPTNIYTFRKILSRFTRKYDKSGFIDFGSGKGLALLLAASYGFRKVTGVEFSKELCKASIINSLRFKNGLYKNRIKTVYLDASKYDIDLTDNVFYFGNPFDDVVFTQVLENIRKSLQSKNRPIIILYYFPRYDLEKLCGFLKKLDECIILGKKYCVYTNI